MPQLGGGGGPPNIAGVITTHHPGSLIKVAQMARHWANDMGGRGAGWIAFAH